MKSSKFLRTHLLQNTVGGCFCKIYLDSPEKVGYTLPVEYMQLFDKAYFLWCSEISPAVREERYYLIASGDQTETAISPSQCLCVSLV